MDAQPRKPYWVPTREEAEAITVPSEPTLDSKLTNEIEFQKSDELLVPGKKMIANFFFCSTMKIVRRNCA